uniref:Uncharacterized protein n=1 Tax=Timema cristinae TaxID=61476 RepID=A0A7R9D8N9_TIMCR|nr:unnamed protein product [Timema cristinae]
MRVGMCEIYESSSQLFVHIPVRGLTSLQTFDEEQAVAITEANAAISCSSIIADLAYVKSSFGNLPGAITALEAKDLPLVKAVKIMRGIEESLNQASGSVGTAIVDKFNRALQRNPGNPYSGYTNRVATKLFDELLPTLADKGCHVVSTSITPAIKHGFLCRSHYYFIRALPGLERERTISINFTNQPAIKDKESEKMES